MKPTLPRRLRIRAFKSSIQSSAPVQRAIRAAYYRGGTSRAVIIHPRDLPSDRKVWPGVFRQLMGSGDPYGRQLDGMGAGISSLSKICLVESHRKEKDSGLNSDPGIDQAKHSQAEEILQGEIDTREAHVDYTFVGLGIENDEVDVAGNCGNMSSAIGPYAYNARLLPRQMYVKADGEVTVKIRNTNTGRFIDSTFTVVRRQAAVTGDYTIDGVTGKGSKIKLDFRNPYGSKTGKVLPTGKKMDTIAGYKVTCVDGANPAVFIRADDVGVDGTILPNDFSKLSSKLDLLERIRKSAAVAMGIARAEDEVPRTIPKIGIVSMSATHPVLSGATLKTSQMDLVVRFISDTQPHRAIPLTVALTTAVAARIPGTIVEQLLAPDLVVNDAITIGHASGRLQVNATMDSQNPLTPLSATVYRTAKRLFEGNVYWTPDTEPETLHTRMRKRHSLGMAFVMESRSKSHIYPSETTAKKDEEVSCIGNRIVPYLNDGQGKLSLDGQPQHANLERNDDPLPRSDLERLDHPYETLSPREFNRGPEPQTKAPESPPKGQAQHPNHGTATEQPLSPNPPSPPHGETTWPPCPSQPPGAREASRSYVGSNTKLHGSQARSKETGSPAITTVAKNEQGVDADVAATIATTSIPQETQSGVDKQLFAYQIASEQEQMTALKRDLNTLITAPQFQIISDSSAPSRPSFSNPLPTASHYVAASSQGKGGEWSHFAKGLAKREVGLRKTTKDTGKKQAERATLLMERESHFGLDKKWSLKKSRKDRVGRGW